MPEFRYRAKDENARNVMGRRFAPSVRSLIIQLERKGLTAVSVEEVPEEKAPLKKKITTIRTRGGKVKSFELTILCRQLATMLQGGVPILNAMESIADEMKNAKFKKVIQDVNQDLREGKALSESLRTHPDVFSELFVAIVEAGEKVGSLDEMLRRLSGYLESRDRLINKVRSATSYPIFIAVFFLVALLLVTIFLIPKFQGIYEGFGAKLPGLTLFIFGISNFLIKNLPLAVIMFTMIGFSFFFFINRTEKGRFLFDRTLLRLPLFGVVIKKAAISKFCRTLSTLLAQGIPITDGLLLVGRTSGNVIIERASDKASSLIVEGESIPDAITRTAVFPSLMLQMARVGVESGSLPELMDKTADFYEEQVDNFINNLTTILEPILMVSLGAVIAVAVIALYLPVFRLSAVLGGT